MPLPVRSRCASTRTIEQRRLTFLLLICDTPRLARLSALKRLSRDGRSIVYAYETLPSVERADPKGPLATCGCPLQSQLDNREGDNGEKCPAARKIDASRGLFAARQLKEPAAAHFALHPIIWTYIGGWLRTVSSRIRAVEGVAFDLFEAETLSIVGESGCGKSTTGRGLMRLVTSQEGSVKLAGRDLMACLRASCEKRAATFR